MAATQDILCPQRLPFRRFREHPVAGDSTSGRPSTNVQRFEAMLRDDPIAVRVEQGKWRLVVRWREQAWLALLSLPGEPLQRPRIQVQVMHRGRTKVRHARGCGTGAPACEKVFAGIEDAYLLGLDASLADEPGSEVYTMDAAADDQPRNLLPTVNWRTDAGGPAWGESSTYRTRHAVTPPSASIAASPRPSGRQ